MIPPRAISLVTPFSLAATAAALLISVLVGFVVTVRSGKSLAADEAAIAFRGVVTARAVVAVDTAQALENSALGYLLTGRSDERNRYDAAKADLDAATRDLAAALPPTAHLLLPDLHSGVERRIAYLDSAIAARSRGDGFDPAAFVDVSSTEHARTLYMGLVRASLPIVEERMRAYLEQRRLAEESALHAVALLAAIATFGAIVLILAAAQRIMLLRDFVRQSDLVNQELAAAQERARVAGRAKTQLITAVSHDIRQPLHAVSIYLDVLSRRIEDSSVAPIVERIEAAMTSMARMARQLLDVSRYDDNGYQAKREPLDLDGIFESVVTDVGAQAWATGVRVRVVRTSLEPIGDAGLVESIVRNLVWNAITYAAGGQVLLGARRHGDAVDIEVRDDGPGLPEPLRRQFDGPLDCEAIAAVETSGKGLGLGLALVRRCADLLNAPLTLAPSPRGACFRLRLPRYA